MCNRNINDLNQPPFFISKLFSFQYCYNHQQNTKNNSYGKRWVSDTSTAVTHAKGSSARIGYVRDIRASITDHRQCQRNLQTGQTYRLFGARFKCHLSKIEILNCIDPKCINVFGIPDRNTMVNHKEPELKRNIMCRERALTNIFSC